MYPRGRVEDCGHMCSALPAQQRGQAWELRAYAPRDGLPRLSLIGAAPAPPMLPPGGCCLTSLLKQKGSDSCPKITSEHSAVPSRTSSVSRGLWCEKTACSPRGLHPGAGSGSGSAAGAPALPRALSPRCPQSGQRQSWKTWGRAFGENANRF